MKRRNNAVIERASKTAKSKPFFIFDSVSNENFNQIPIIGGSELNERLITTFDGTSTGDSYRIGETIRIHKIYWSFSIINFEPEEPVFCRHLLLWDKWPNGNSVSSSTVPDDIVVDDIIIADDVDAPFNPKLTNRWIILNDTRYTLQPPEIGPASYIWNGTVHVDLLQTFDNTTGRPITGRVLQIDMCTGPVAGCILDGYISMRYSDN